MRHNFPAVDLSHFKTKFGGSLTLLAAIVTLLPSPSRSQSAPRPVDKQMADIRERNNRSDAEKLKYSLTSARESTFLKVEKMQARYTEAIDNFGSGGCVEGWDGFRKRYTDGLGELNRIALRVAADIQSRVPRLGEIRAPQFGAVEICKPGGAELRAKFQSNIELLKSFQETFANGLADGKKVQSSLVENMLKPSLEKFKSGLLRPC